MPTLLYLATTLAIALVDSFLKESSAYTVVNVTLRVAILLPLLFSVAETSSRYGRRLRWTLWTILVADVLLPLYFPAGMGVFLIVHLLNAANFHQYVALRRDTLHTVVLPGVLTLALSLALYRFVLFPTMDGFFRVLVGIYLLPIALATSLAISSFLQGRAPWAGVAAAGMSLFYATDVQVAAEFLTDLRIPLYGLVNALTYYGGLYLMARATHGIRD
jgi:hypothetical protein